MIDVIRNELVLLRVVPHSSVLNSSNRKLWRVLHDLLAVDDPLARRLTRNGLRLTYRVRDRVYWVVTMRAEAGEDGEVRRRVEFFVLLPRPFAEVFSAKLRTHEQWRRCTVQEAEPAALGIPQGAGLDLYALKLARHDMFSLHTDYSRQTSPVRDLLQVTGEMQPGDYAGLFVDLEAVGRRRWQALSEYAWDEWNTGRVPQRAVFDAGRLWRSLWAGFASVAAEAKALVDDFMAAVEGAFFPGRAQEKRQQAALALPDPERQALLVNGDLSRESHSKRNLPVFKAGLLALVGAGTEARRNMLAHSLGAAFGELAGDNRLQPVRVHLSYTQHGAFRLPDHIDRDPNLLSVDEVGRVIQLPTAEVQEEFRDALEANRAVEVPVPAAFSGPGIYAGTATLKGEVYPVHVPTGNLDMLMTPRVLIGSPRMGKDMACVNWVVEAALQHGHGAVVLDVIDERNGHRGMADALRDHLPPERAIDLNLGDFSHPVPITLDGITNTTDERIVADRLAKEIVNFFLDDSDQHQTREYLRAAAKAVAGDLLGIKLILTNAAYRKGRIAALRAQNWDTTLLEEFDRMTEGRQGQIAGPVLVRLGEILEDEALRPMFCQRPKPAASLRRWLQEGKVVLYRVPARDLSEPSVRILAHWLTMTVFLTKLALGGAGAPPTWFILNEPHQYLSPGFIHFCGRMLAEGPKYRLAPMFLLHNLKQLPGDFVEVLMSSSLNWHVFKNTNAYVYERLSQYLAPTFTPETAMAATKRFHYVAVWLDENGEYQTPFMVQAPALVWDRVETRRNEWLTKRHSRQYGRPYAEVEVEIRERHRAGA